MSRKGVASLWVLIPLAGSGIALYLFIRKSRANPAALFNLGIFRHRVYVYCILITIVRSIALFGGTFLVPFLLQGVLRYSEMKSGLMLLPNSAVMAILTPMAGALSDKFGARKLVVPGLLLVALSMFQFSQINSPDEVYVILAMVVRGTGLGLLVSTLTATAMSAVTLEEAPDASSMYSLIMQLGGSVGIAFSGLFQQFIQQYYTMHRGYTALLAGHYAIQDVFIISGILVLISLMIAFRLPNRAMAKKELPVVHVG